MFEKLVRLLAMNLAICQSDTQPERGPINSLRFSPNEKSAHRKKGIGTITWAHI